jgi:two-component system, response regulator PdtaR
LPEAEAFRLLQRQSQDRRMPMAKLAESIVQADELLESPSSVEPLRRGSGGYSHDE